MKKVENTNVTDKYVESKSIRNITLDSVDYDCMSRTANINGLHIRTIRTWCTA